MRWVRRRSVSSLSPPSLVELVLVVLEQEGSVVVDAAQRLLQVVGGDVGELVQFLVAAQQLGVAALEFDGVEAELLLGLACVR